MYNIYIFLRIDIVERRFTSQSFLSISTHIKDIFQLQ